MMLTTVVSSCAIALIGLQGPFSMRSAPARAVSPSVSGSQKIEAAKKAFKGGGALAGLSESLTLSVRAPHVANKGFVEFLGAKNYCPHRGMFGEALLQPVGMGGGGFVPTAKMCGLGVYVNVATVGKPLVITLYFESAKSQAIQVMDSGFDKLGTLQAKAGSQSAIWAVAPTKKGWQSIAFIARSNFEFFKAEIDVVQ